jgi:hypothetical protein
MAQSVECVASSGVQRRLLVFSGILGSLAVPHMGFSVGSPQSALCIRWNWMGCSG